MSNNNSGAPMDEMVLDLDAAFRDIRQPPSLLSMVTDRDSSEHTSDEDEQKKQRELKPKIQLEKNALCDSINKMMPISLSSKTALRINVTGVATTAKWKWRHSIDDACGICRAPFEACCTSCKMPGDDCPIMISECRHPFHYHCISRWVDTQQKPSCPLCRTEWKQNAISMNRVFHDSSIFN